MNRKDRIKLSFTRNWNLPGKERLSHWLRPSADLKRNLNHGITWLTGEDIAINTTADNYIEWSILSTGTYEDEISKLIRISLNEGDTALDIGGNIGLQSIRMGKAVGKAGKVIAFEPLNYLQKKFNANIALNRLQNVQLMPYALSDADGEAEYHLEENGWNQGTFSLNNRNTGTAAQQIIIKKGDELAEIKAIDNLSLIKIDVEGYEQQVITGLTETIKKHKPRLIFEYDQNYWVAAGQSITTCFDLLQQLNYNVYQITAVGCEHIQKAADIIGGNLFCLQAENE